MPTLSDAEIAEGLGALPAWSHEGGAIVRTIELESFGAAVALVVRVAFLAESAGHHPDVDLRYATVRLALRTHSEGGVTGADLDLAARLDAVLPPA